MKNKLDTLTELTLKKNEVMNLTAIKEPNEFYEKMIVDSLKVDELCHLFGEVLDLGTGAGFPGLPLAINNSNINVTLLDSTNKKVAHVNDVIKTLDLTNAVAVSARAEEYAHLRRDKFDFVVSRAVAPINVLLELCASFTKENGFIIAMKGPKHLLEIKEAENCIKKLRLQLTNIFEYELPNSKEHHSLVVFKKIGPTPNKYPRTYSLIKDKPL